MSDYYDVWEHMHGDQIKIEHKADQCKKVLVDNLSSDIRKCSRRNAWI